MSKMENIYRVYKINKMCMYYFMYLDGMILYLF